MVPKGLDMEFLRDTSPERDTGPVNVTVKTSAQRYFQTLNQNEAVYLLWDVDGVATDSGWTAFAYPEHQFQIRSRTPFVTKLCGIKVVVPEAQRIGDLNGRVLTYEGGRLYLK